MFLIYSNYGLADDLEKIQINFISGVKLDIDKKNIVELNYPDMDFNNKKIFKFENGLLNEVRRLDQKELNSISLESEKQLVLDKNEYIKIKGVDNREKLFNGSIIIEFKTLPSFNFFALGNDLLFVSDLSDINRGVFKIQNLNGLQEKINNLQKDVNILSIELDVLDQSVTSQ